MSEIVIDENIKIVTKTILTDFEKKVIDKMIKKNKSKMQIRKFLLRQKLL